jgi:hypothetical protein
VLTVPALNVELGSFGRHDRGADDNSGDTDEPRNRHGVEVPNGHLLGVGVEEKLVVGDLGLGVVREEDSVRAFLESRFELK